VNRINQDLLEKSRSELSKKFFKILIDFNKFLESDVHAIVGTGKKPYICARRIDNSNREYYSTGTDSNQNGHHKWLPYYTKIVK